MKELKEYLDTALLFRGHTLLCQWGYGQRVMVRSNSIYRRN
jgi:hypothetical protein